MDIIIKRENEIVNTNWFNPYKGKEYSVDEIKKSIEKCPLIKYKYCSEYTKIVAELIAEGNIVGWFQGRAEIGPRALGHRSILADPRRKDMKDIINSKVKMRESFRPFAPSILWEYQKEYFELNIPEPYMLMACEVKESKKNIIPAVTHIDGTGRVQSVLREIVPDFYELIEEFYKITNVPVVLNTSFNIKGEPIVETPVDALNCFLGTGIDYLVMDRYVISKIHKD